ncbi:MAG TPA: ATP-binding cassette domain-containing protein [Actinotalea sp.]|nr:ATP-binding cassette domain-containing protein [Actinotalea sp.]
MAFESRVVIRDLSFDVHAGETFGFLGSNGSGKTTTLRALLGIYRPTAGTLHIAGRRFAPGDGTRLGYLPEERGLYTRESVLDVMVYFGRLKGLGARTAREWSRAYLERVGLAGRESTRVDRLSGGQQQKVQLGVTIMNDPELLILDEPTQGFDPVNRRLLMDLIEDRRRAGAAVIMVTHQMDEVERLCDRVILLKDGVAAAYGTIDEVRDRYGGTVLRVQHTGLLPASDRYTVRRSEGSWTELVPRAGVPEVDVLRELVDHAVDVRSFTTERTPLEEIFLSVYGTPDDGSGR